MVAVHHAVRVTYGVFPGEITVTHDRVSVKLFIGLQSQIRFNVHPHIGVAAIFSTKASCVVDMARASIVGGGDKEHPFVFILNITELTVDGCNEADARI